MLSDCYKYVVLLLVGLLLVLLLLMLLVMVVVVVVPRVLLLLVPILVLVVASAATDRQAGASALQCTVLDSGQNCRVQDRTPTNPQHGACRSTQDNARATSRLATDTQCAGLSGDLTQTRC